MSKYTCVTNMVGLEPILYFGCRENERINFFFSLFDHDPQQLDTAGEFLVLVSLNDHIKSAPKDS